MAKQMKNENILLTEKTIPQVFYQPSSFDQVLPLQQTKLSYEQLRCMREMPLINLARHFLTAATMLSGWSIATKEGCPPELRKLVEDNILPMREQILLNSISGCVDFGWQGFEKVFEYNGENIVLKKLKPLLQDLTEIIVDPSTGKFLGLRCRNIVMNEDHKEQYEHLELDKSLVVNIDVEGTNWYGNSLLLTAFEPYKNWHAVECSSNRYFNKMAGSRFVLKYPTGQVNDNGTITTTAQVAEKLLNSLENNNPIAIPKSLERQKDSTNDANNDAWEVDILSDNAGSSNITMFIDKQKYNDSKITEAFGIPQRAVLEGMSGGTRAEGESVTDTALILMDSRHRIILNQINKHVVNHIIRLNYGSEYENKCYIEPTPLSDANIHFLQGIYNQLLSMDPTEQDNVDRQSLRDKLGIPTDNSNNDYLSIQDMVKQKGSSISSEENVQNTALNGAQVTAAVDIVTRVSAGELAAETAIEMLQEFFTLQKTVAENIVYPATKKEIEVKQ